jgi:hypothetical protein
VVNWPFSAGESAVGAVSADEPLGVALGDAGVS